MSLKKRYYALLLFVAAAAVATGFVTSQTPLELRKTSIANQALRSAGCALDEACLPNAVQRAATVFDFFVQENPNACVVLLRVDGNWAYELSPSNEEHTKWVLDLINTVSLFEEKRVLPQTPIHVRNIVGRVYAIEPVFVTRITFDLVQPAELVTERSDKGLHIRIIPRLQSASNSNPVDELKAAVITMSRQLDVERLKTIEILNRELDRELGSLLPALDQNARNQIPSAFREKVDESYKLALAEIEAVSAQLDKAEIGSDSKVFGALRGRIESTLLNAQQTFKSELATARAQIGGVAFRLQNSVTAVAEPSVPENNALSLIAGNLLPKSYHLPESSKTTPSTETALFTPVPLADLAYPTQNVMSFAATAEEPVAESTPEPETSGSANDSPNESSENTALPPSPSQNAAESVPDVPQPSSSGTFLPRQDQKDGSIPFVRNVASQSYKGDPLYAPVTIDFREMELTNAVALLAQAAKINVIAGTDVTVAGTVTAYLKDVPLLTAIETVLRMNDLGIVEEEGIFRIVPYEQAVAARRTTRMIHLDKGDVSEIEKTLQSIGQSFPGGEQVSVSSNKTTNTLLLTGPAKRLVQLETIAKELDVAKPVLPTVTETIKLNYSEPQELLNVVKGVLTPEGVGTVEVDTRGRQLIVTDMPVVLDQVKALIKQLDVPVKQVGIEAMVIDAVMRDNAQTGVSWLLDLVREHPSPQAELPPLRSRVNRRGNVTGTVHDLNTAVDFVTQGASAGNLAFGLLTDSFDLRGAISAEVLNRKAQILANPVVVTTENKTATIDIVQDFPYTQLTQSTQGPPVASTAFKSVGITLEVIPRVTHNNEIMVDINTKQSSISGFSADNIPIEEKRTAKTTLRTTDNRTIFIGGLRRADHTTDIRKVPVLGDVPVLSLLFRNNTINKINTELLVFLTCHVIDDVLPELTAEQQTEYDRLDNTPRVPNAEKDLYRSLLKPREVSDPALKWRRTQ